ncbi:unnamed protein product [Lactuca virosa]|uniref:TPX2 C-terminal domain-containing protein n=1 Tax=Lactuca virosa TaxID=75947 RepID=A0AAU9MVZ6_9ASTR|nr:unnamed protein product [Lactuca virosa]
MEDGPGGASSGAICRTPVQIANVNTPVANTSPITRMQNMEGPRETLQITTVVRHKNATTGGLVEEGGTSQQRKTTKKIELEEFEAFESFRTMRRLQKEKQLHKEKE